MERMHSLPARADDYWAIAASTNLIVSGEKFLDIVVRYDAPAFSARGPGCNVYISPSVVTTP